MMTDLVRISEVVASAFLNSAPGLKVGCDKSITSLYSVASEAMITPPLTLPGCTVVSMAPRDL